MKKDLINQLKKARVRLYKAIKLYPDHPKGQWSKKELLSHFAGWDEEEVRELKEALEGRPFSFNEEIDGYNNKSVEKRKDKSIKEILEEMRHLHTQIIQIVDKLEEKQVSDNFGITVRGKKVNLEWIIKETFYHDNEHAKEIEEEYGS